MVRAEAAPVANARRKHGLGGTNGAAPANGSPCDPAALTTTALLPDNRSSDLVKSFNCGLSGHSQVACTRP